MDHHHHHHHHHRPLTLSSSIIIHPSSSSSSIIHQPSSTIQHPASSMRHPVSSIILHPFYLLQLLNVSACFLCFVMSIRLSQIVESIRIRNKLNNLITSYSRKGLMHLSDILMALIGLGLSTFKVKKLPIKTESNCDFFLRIRKCESVLTKLHKPAMHPILQHHVHTL